MCLRNFDGSRIDFAVLLSISKIYKDNISIILEKYTYIYTIVGKYEYTIDFIVIADASFCIYIFAND